MNYGMLSLVALWQPHVNKRSLSEIHDLLKQSLLIKLVDKVGDIVFATLLQDISAMCVNGMNAYE